MTKQQALDQAEYKRAVEDQAESMLIFLGFKEPFNPMELKYIKDCLSIAYYGGRIDVYTERLVKQDDPIPAQRDPIPPF